MSAPETSQPPTLAAEAITALVAGDPELRAALVSSEDLAFIRQGRSAIELIERACRRYAGRPCLAERASVRDPYRALTYAQLWERVQALATGWAALGLAGAGDAIGICGYASTDWIIADIACLYSGAISVPLQGTLNREEQLHIITQAQLAMVVVSADRADAIAEILVACPTVRSVLVIDGDVTTRAAAADRVRANLPERSVFALDAVLTRGRDLAPLPVSAPDSSAAPLFSVVYTSGSTGLPKGVMLPEARWSATLRDALGFAAPFPFLSFGYLPLSHMAGRINVYLAMMLGGCTSFVTRSDMSSLFDDLRAVRPTHLVLVPRLSMMLHQMFQAELLRRGIEYAPEVIDDPRARPVLEDLRVRTMGGRLVFAATGSAPTAPEVATFISRCLGLPLVDSYGSTEVARITVDGRVQPGVEYKLVDVPELGYTRADKPYPRGELAVKSSRVTPGYYNNPEATRAMLDADGFFLTGDVVEERAPGRIAWLDRRNNVLRLAHGEFVNTSHLEELYAASSPFIHQVYIYGNPHRSYVLAVVVPATDALAAALAVGVGDLGAEHARVTAMLRAALDAAAQRAAIASYACPRDFLVEWEPFSRENGLLTDANKPRRVQLKQRYAERLEALYEQLEARRVQSISSHARAEGVTILDRIQAAIALVLGVSVSDVTGGERSFVQMGGDSLGAVRLTELIVELCGVTVSAAMLLDPTTSVHRLAREVERLHREARAQPAADHGEQRAWSDASEHVAEAWLTGDELAAAAGARPPPGARRILVTGANGFLGHFVVAALVEGAAKQGGSVVALVRADSDVAAFERFAERWRRSGLGDVPASNLEVIAGDLMAERFGLDDPSYQRLADGVDAIVHCGALVNHALSYAHLYKPNVAGTAEVMRLAVRGTIKRLHFVSTTGVAAGCGLDVVPESAAAAQLWPKRRIDDGGYAMGYASSKWAAEAMLDSLHAVTAIPLRIFRCGMILPHRQLAVAINEGDTFYRLWYGMLRTGEAPVSFYGPDYRDERHYDGLPVDLVAQVIADVVLDAGDGRQVLHVSNSNWSAGISLDTMLDVAQAAGYALRRRPYDEWYEVFRRALEALPPAAQRRSPLAIIERWRHPAGAGTGLLKMETHAFAAALAAHGRGIGVPVLDEEYLRHCLRAIDRLP